MNKERRKKIANVISKLEDLNNEIDSIREEEQDTFDSIPENLQESENGQLMQEAIENLENAFSDVESALESLNEI